MFCLLWVRSCLAFFSFRSGHGWHKYGFSLLSLAFVWFRELVLAVLASSARFGGGLLGCCWFYVVRSVVWNGVELLEVGPISSCYLEAEFVRIVSSASGGKRNRMLQGCTAVFRGVKGSPGDG